MEIKDVNNVVNQFLSFRSQGVAASSGALGAGFASFMSQTADILSATGSKEAVKTASAERPEHADKSSKPAERTEDKKTKPSKKERSDESAAAPAAENTERKMKTPEKADAAAVQNTSASEPEPKSAAPAEAPAAAAAAEAGAAGKPVLQVNPQGETRTTELNVALLGTDSAASFAAVMDGNTLTLLSQNIDLQTVAALETVNVLDAASGEVVTMSGAEFAAKLQQASNAGELFVYGEVSGKFVEQLPLEVVSSKQEESSKAVSADNLAKNTAAYDDPALAEQALALDDKLGSGQKVKVNVSVKEEKNAASLDQGLIQDKVSLQEAIDASLAQEEKMASGASKTKNEQLQSPLRQQAQQSAPAANASAAPVAAAVNVAAPAENAGSSVAAAKVASVGEISGNVTSHAAAGNGEILAGARSEAADKSSGTSFRDIYKGMSKEVVDQVKVNITKSAVRGVDKIDIRLRPEDLGHIEIKMQISKDGKLQAHIISSRPETMEILQKEVQNLEKAFNDAGFQTDDSSLSFSFRNEGQAGQEQDRNAELRSFIGSVLENEKSEELVSNDNLLYWDPAQGLNIRV